MVTKKQLLVRAQLHLARNEEEPLTCYTCLAIDKSATLTIQELEERSWWQKLLKPTKALKIRQMRDELQTLSRASQASPSNLKTLNAYFQGSTHWKYRKATLPGSLRGTCC